MLCLLALILPVDAAVMSFESGLDGFSAGSQDATYKHSGSYSLLPGASGYSALNANIPTNATISMWLYIPSSSIAVDQMNVYLYSADKFFCLVQSYPVGSKWGIYQGSYINTGISVIPDVWKKLEIVKRGSLVSYYMDGTLLYADSTGVSGTYTPQIKFYRGSSAYYVDDIEVKDDDIVYTLSTTVMSGLGTVDVFNDRIAYYNQGNFTTNVFPGEYYELTVIPAPGYVLQKYCMDINCNTQGVNTTYIYGEITNSNINVYLYYVQSNTMSITDVILTSPSSSSIGIFVQSAGQGTYGLSMDGFEIETKQMTQSGSTSFLFGSLSPGSHEICAYDVLEPTTDKICKSITLTAPTPTPSPSPTATATVSPTPTISPTPGSTTNPTPQPTNTPNPNGIVSFYVTQADATIKITGGITKQVDLYPTNVSCSNQEFIISRSGYYSYRDKCFSNSYHISLTPTGSLGKAYIGDIIDPYIWFQGITTQANGSKQAIIAVKRDLSFPEYDVMLTFNSNSVNRIPMAEITGYYNVSDKYFNISTIGSNYIDFTMSNAQICDPLATKAAYLCDGSNLPAGPTNPITTPPNGYNPMKEKTEDFMASGMMISFIIMGLFIGAGVMFGGAAGMAIGFVSGVSFCAYFEMLPMWMLFLVAIVTITAFSVMVGGKITGSSGD